MWYPYSYAFGLYLAVGILRVEGGLDYSNLTEVPQEEEEATYNANAAANPTSSSAPTTSSPNPSALPSSVSAGSFDHYQNEADLHPDSCK